MADGLKGSLAAKARRLLQGPDSPWIAQGRGAALRRAESGARPLGTGVGAILLQVIGRARIHAFGSALLAGSAVLYTPAAHALPSFAQVRQDFVSSESLLLDRNGEIVHRLRTNPQVRRGQWVALADVSPALRTALLLSEDKRFYEHSGVDWQAAGAAAWGNLWNTHTRGASTITMQLVGLIDDDLKRGQGGRTLLQKFGQAASARMLDGRWRKDEILEAYLNLVPFRGEIVGIDALSRTLFGKAAHGLDAREAAITAALVRAPNAGPDAVGQRACGVLASMQKTPRSAVLCDSLGLYAAGVMQRKAWAPSDGNAPHLARRLLSGQPAGTRLRSTLSAPLQRLATQQLLRQMHELAGRNVQDGAVLVLDTASGDVLAWVGASVRTSHSPEVDAVLAPRQPGSTLKPLLYAQAIAERRLTAASLLHDSPAAIPTQSGLYIPQNYDRHFKGWVSVRTALGNSLNVPAVRTIGMVGVNPFARQLRQLGIALARTGDYYGYSLALGSPEMNLLQLTNAYRALANGGRWAEVRTQLPNAPAANAGDGGNAASATTGAGGFSTSQPATGNPAFRQAIDERAAFIVGQILSDNNARLVTFGPNSLLHTRFWTAVKTGTSKDMRDNWVVGWSQRYTIGVWVGNARGDAMWDVSGTSGAAPIWAALMQHLHASTPSRAPMPPPGVVSRQVRFDVPPSAGASLREPPRTEWFITGTEQAVFAVAPQAGRTSASALARIDSPSDGTILALDPDIPPERQRLMLRTRVPNAQWWISGKRIGQGNAVGWLPWPGRHSVELRQGDGKVLDRVGIEVRGAGVRTGANGTSGRP